MTVEADKNDPAGVPERPISESMSELGDLTERELKLTAVLYVKLGAVEILRKTGRLPDRIGGLWNVIPMRHVIEGQGTDPTLSADEQLVYEAIISEAASLAALSFWSSAKR